MSSWAVTDDTPTATVVWAAAEQIGKTQNHDELQKICDYLVNKHWFQTAGDLRSARSETTEWQALAVPGRLKLAIQQVLDQTALPNYGYEDYYAAVRPSLAPAGSETSTQDWVGATTGYEGAEQATPDYYSSTYAYTPSDTATDATTAQYGYDQADYLYSAGSDPPPYDESYRANYEHYYSGSSSASSYDSGAAATALLSLQGGVGQPQLDENDVVEAHAVEAEITEECDEGELAPDQSSYAVELGEPSQRDASETAGTWRCGQCTYLNPMTSSFCEVCVGHISLSPDVKTTAGTSVSASLLIPAKPAVDIMMHSPQAEPPVNSFSVQTPQPTVTCMLPPVRSLYPPSAPDFESSGIREDEPVDASPLPPPPPYPGTSSCGNVDFLALAFNGKSAPKTQAQPPSPTGKSSQMRREEAITEYTF
ncbi:hypothetical protein PHYPSEUDO_000366 [Phytophthora pseudosyringae]|uniref:RanBP2-type domain-containing protein n=1 Tax=Phytophthora pseudosyringae TaxID=221518 RepID=A0A8T1VYT1_9STRA|nr:hypothetical protein PHYPSEUDO_000366 [Phytophthora pseudosyringae]